MEANLEYKEPTLKKMESRAEHREDPKEHATVNSSGTMKKQHRGWNLATERRQKPKERIHGNCGSHRKLTIAGRMMICCARVAWCKRGIVRRNWIRAKVERGTRRSGMRQEGKMSIKDLGCRQPLYLRRKRTTTDSIRGWKSEQLHLMSKRTTSEIYRKIVRLEVVKQATKMSTGLLKMWNWTLWRGRPLQNGRNY
jgi:hypothetical protein